MSNDSTRRRKEDRRYPILDYIDLYKTSHNGFSPTDRQISGWLKLNGTGNIHYNIDRMENEDGWITSEKTEEGHRRAGTIRLTEAGVEQLRIYRENNPSLPAQLEGEPMQEELPLDSPIKDDPVRMEERDSEHQNGTNHSSSPKKPIYEISAVILSARISNRKAVREIRIPVMNFIAASFDVEMPSSDFSVSALDPESYLLINQDMLTRYRIDDLFALQVRGDSMIEAGIQSGDYVILKQTQSADNGDMCAVWIDGKGGTLKYFYREDRRVRLEAANANIAPMTYGPSHTVAIQGKVILVVRL